MDELNLPQEATAWTPQEILSLRRAGLPRPEKMTMAEWQAPTKLNNQHELICYLAATGTRKEQIVEVVGLTKATVNQVLSSERVKFRIKEIQFQLYGKDPHKRFESMLSSAIQTVSDILESDSAKPNTKLMAANTVFDRVMGKPVQEIKNHSTTLVEFYARLDKVFDGKNNPDSVEADYEIVPENKKIDDPTKDHIDQWMDENFT
jgi:hypothetical protein